MKVYIGADHAGFEMKEKLKTFLGGLGYEVEDKGAHSFDANDDYPDFIHPVAEAVSGDETSRGIILGGSGQGEAICANRVKGVRAALFYGLALAKEAIDVAGNMSTDPYEIVKLARLHNNANILSLSGRFLSEEEMQQAIRIFLTTDFIPEERHLRRINKLDK